MVALQIWETLKESITVYTGLSPATFFTALAAGLALYYLALNFFGSSSNDDGHGHGGHGGFEEKMEPLPPPVQVGEISDEELKEYDGSDPKKPLLMAIKGQIYDVSQSRMFYGPGGPYALFAGKDASRALAKMSFEEKDLNGDLTGLGVFELEALQDWEYKFMGKYVKVGTVKSTVRVSEVQATEAAESDAAVRPEEIADRDVVKPAEDGQSDTTTKESSEEKKE
ncbi:membrane steroid-binding protein 2 [Phtheirospermum japonicum]|uniref:Membrane steroid-binding protein 2 n=1 Tax=Phtheirospermum japonicum TaxID=374723 RepID=A0A830B3F2_9LAMI|nr:membrane steroid-binding protein 2 [Phtheirospermum japonicum]